MKAIVFILLLFFAEQVLTALIGTGLDTAGWVDSRAVALGVAALPAQAVLLAVLALTGLVRRRLPADRVALRPGSTLAALAATGFLIVATAAVGELLGADDHGTTELFRSMMGQPLCLVSLAIVGPLTEEVVFREGLVRHMMLSGLNRWAAVALAAAVFALVHGNLAQGLPAFVLGLAFGAFYVATGDLRLPVAAHVLVNSIGLISYSLNDPADTPSDTEGLLFAAIGCGAAAACLLVAWHRLRLRNL